MMQCQFDEDYVLVDSVSLDVNEKKYEQNELTKDKYFECKVIVLQILLTCERNQPNDTRYGISIK